jgi:hypothetical protein
MAKGCASMFTEYVDFGPLWLLHKAFCGLGYNTRQQETSCPARCDPRKPAKSVVLQDISYRRFKGEASRKHVN